jgi:hypothetical protein
LVKLLAEDESVMKQYETLPPLFSSYSLSRTAEDVVNASLGLIFGALNRGFPQLFPQACGKPLPLKVLL